MTAGISVRRWHASRAVPVLGVAGAVLVLSAMLTAHNRTPVDLLYDARIAYQVAHSMVTEGSFRVYDDPFLLNLPYSSYGIGMSLLMAVAEVVGPHLGTTALELDALINPVLLTLIAVVVWLTARRLGAGVAQAGVVSLVVSLATPLLPYAMTALSEVGAALGVAVAIWGITIARDRPLLGGAVAGAGAGIAALMRPDSLAIIAPVVAVGAVLASRERTGRWVARDLWRAAAGVAAGAAPAIALTGWYNAVRFGSPLVTQYQGLSLAQSFTAPFWRGLYGLLLSPGRGLLLYAPVVLLVAVAARWAWQRSPVLTVVCVVLLVDRLLFYASWWAWHGGLTWGPRFLVPAMPVVAPFLLEVLRRLPRPRTPARVAAVAGVTVLVALSLGVQVLGAVTDPAGDRLIAEVNRLDAAQPHPSQNYLVTYNTPVMIGVWSDPMYEWSLWPIADHAQQLLHGRNLRGRWLNPQVRGKRLAAAGAVVLLCVAVALRPPSFRRRRRAGGTPGDLRGQGAAAPGPATGAATS